MNLPEVRLMPMPGSDDAAPAVGGQKHGEVGARHKLGGQPDWVQSEETPPCPECDEPMTFYGQLDSIDGNCTLVDGGMIYVFVCFDCFATKSILQWTNPQFEKKH